MSQNNAQDGEKMFSLKGVELQTIGNINRRNNDSLLDFLSFVALERLAYDVTANTSFRVDDEGNLYIKEVEAVATAETEPGNTEVAVA